MPFMETVICRQNNRLHQVLLVMVFMTVAENIDVAPLEGSTAGRAGMNHTLEDISDTAWQVV